MNTQKFAFTNYDVEIEISGHTFTMDCSSDTGDYLKKCAGDLREMAEAISRGEKTAEDAVSYGAAMLDTLLGDGAFEKVFEGRKKRLSDVADICVWLTQVATKFQQERNKVNMNRAQRRAAAKKA